jgi:hypothetical protein
MQGLSMPGTSQREGHLHSQCLKGVGCVPQELRCIKDTAKQLAVTSTEQFSMKLPQRQLRS